MVDFAVLSAKIVVFDSKFNSIFVIIVLPAVSVYTPLKPFERLSVGR